MVIKSETIYKILQLTDVHVMNDAKKDKKMFQTVKRLVEETKPQLIVITGDITSQRENLDAFSSFCPFIDSFKIPWAFVFGNHEGVDMQDDDTVFDINHIVSREDLCDYLESFKYSIFEKGPKDVDGTGNYYKIIYNNENIPVMSLIMMDSNNFVKDTKIKEEKYDCFHKNQIEWYKKTVNEIAEKYNNSVILPSLLFCHIPFRQFATLTKGGKRLSGIKLEKTCHPYYDDGFFEVIKKIGSTKGIFAGHDHMNNYSVLYDGIRLTYGTTCDYNIFHCPNHGGKIINIKNDGSFTIQEILYKYSLDKIIYKKEI